MSTDYQMLPSPQMLDWTTESSTSAKLNSTTYLELKTSSSTTQNIPITNSTTTEKTIPTVKSTTKTTTIQSTTTATITNVTTTPRSTTIKVTTIVIPTNTTNTPKIITPPPLNNTTISLPSEKSSNKPSDKSSTKTISTYAFLNTTVKYKDTTKPYKEGNRHEYGKYNENVKYDQGNYINLLHTIILV